MHACTKTFQFTSYELSGPLRDTNPSYGIQPNHTSFIFLKHFKHQFVRKRMVQEFIFLAISKWHCGCTFHQKKCILTL